MYKRQTYTVSKSGYNTITGNVNIGDAPRNTINTYLTPVITPPTQPTWPTDPPTTPPTGGIPDEDDDSDGFLMESVRGIANLFGVSFGVGKTILGMLLALSIGTATAKHLRGGAQELSLIHIWCIFGTGNWDMVVRSGVMLKWTNRFGSPRSKSIGGVTD